MGEESTVDGVIVIWEGGTEYGVCAGPCSCGGRAVMSLYDRGEGVVGTGGERGLAGVGVMAALMVWNFLRCFLFLRVVRPVPSVLIKY